MCNLRYYDCHSGQDTQMLYVLVTLDEVTSLLSNPRHITFRLYSFAFITVWAYNLHIFNVYNVPRVDKAQALMGQLCTDA